MREQHLTILHEGLILRPQDERQEREQMRRGKQDHRPHTPRRQRALDLLRVAVTFAWRSAAPTDDRTERTMTHLRTHCLRVLAIVLLAGLATFAASPGAAQEGAGTLAIYAYECPDGIPGSDFSRCHEHPLGGVGYTAVEAGQDNGVGATTGPNGDATISLGAIGGGTVNVRVSPPAGYETGYIACSQEYGAIDGGITFGNVPKDGFITCQWYFVATGGDPDPDPEPTAAPRRDQPRDEPPVSGLPTTGSGPMEVLNDQPWVPTVLGVIAIGLLHAAHARWQRRRE